MTITMICKSFHTALCSKKSIRLVSQGALSVALLLLFSVLNAPDAFSQRISHYAVESFREVRVLPTNDTLIVYRQPSSWWFGLNGGGVGSMYIGTLNVPRLATSFSSGAIPLTGGNGEGIYFGVVGEWQNPNALWGAALRVNLFDRRFTNAQGTTQATIPSIQNPDSVYTRTEDYTARISNDYISISPEVKFNVPGVPIHLLGGLDMDFATSSISELGRRFSDVGDITHIQKDNTYVPKSFRFGAHIGVGVDIYSAVVGSSMRAKLTPYFTVNSGTAVSTGNGSSWNQVFVRAGFTAKFSIDSKRDTILQYDPLYVPPPVYVATVQLDRGISSPRTRLVERLAVADVSYLPVEAPGVLPAEEVEVAYTAPEVEKPVSPSTDERVIGGGAEASAKASPSAKPAVIIPNQSRRFSFATSSSTSLSQSMQQYLDGVVEFLKASSNATVQIQGHTDNVGGAAEQQRISTERADQVVRYLEKKGISRRRLFATSLAARRSIADNRTPEGRLQNRRVEIVVVP